MDQTSFIRTCPAPGCGQTFALRRDRLGNVLKKELHRRWCSPECRKAAHRHRVATEKTTALRNALAALKQAQTEIEGLLVG